MPQSVAQPQTPLEAKSPFDLRVDLGKDVPETDVRSALAEGDMGFMHSFTTGSAVDGIIFCCQNIVAPMRTGVTNVGSRSERSLIHHMNGAPRSSIDEYSRL